MTSAGKDSGSESFEVRILLLLTLTAGIFDAVSFVGLDHVFVAIITGNIVLIGFALSAPELTIGGPLVALAGFVIGAGLTGRLDSSQVNRDGLLRRTVAVEALLLVPAIALAIGYDGEELRRLAILIALGAAMGVRNETMREIRMPELRTTVQTLTLAAIAAEEARGASLQAGVVRRLAGILALLGGAALGGLLTYEAGIVWPLPLLLMIHAGTGLVLVRRRRTVSAADAIVQN